MRWLAWLALLLASCSFQSMDLGGSTLSITPTRQQANGKTASQIVVVVRAHNNTPLPNASVTITGNNCNVTQASPSTDPNGQVTASATSATAGTCTITATVTIAGFSTTLAQSGQIVFIAVPGPTAAFALLVAPGTQWIAGVANNATLAAVDEFGNITPSFTGAVQLTATDVHAVLPASATFTAADGGQVPLAGITLRASGTQRINVVDITAPNLNSSIPLQVSAAAPSTLAFLNAPTSISQCANLHVLQVAVQDVYGNTVTGSTLSVTLTVPHTGSGGTLTGAVLQKVVGGTTTFSNTQFTQASGTVTFHAAAPGITAAQITIPVTAAPLPQVTVLGPAVGTGACMLVPFTLSSACPVNVEIDVDPLNTGAFKRATQGPAHTNTSGVVALGGTGTYTFVWDSTRDLRSFTGTVTLRALATAVNGTSAAVTKSGVTVANTPTSATCSFGFSTGQAVATGGSINVAMGDINNDGRPDAVAINASTLNAVVALGDGAGGFGAPATFAINGGPGQPVLFDEDGDGFLDILVPCINTKGVSLLRGDGTGNFVMGNFAQTFNTPVWLDTGDFNSDGITDLLVVDSVTGINVLLNQGAGVFSPLSANIANGGTVADAVGDLNNDGNLDVLVLNSGAASVLLGDGTGVLNLVANQVTTDSGCTSVVLLDLNGDGNQDFIASCGSNNLDILTGDGTGHFPGGITHQGNGGAATVGVADFNGDRKPDIAVASSGQDAISIGLNSSGAIHNLTAGLSHTHAWALGIGDMNGDGVPDIVSTSNSGHNPDVLAIHLTDGAGNAVQSIINQQSGTIQGMAVTDLNHDGKPDAISGGVTFNSFFGDGAGNLVPQTGLAAGTAPKVVSAAFIPSNPLPIACALDTTNSALTSFQYNGTVMAQVGSVTMPVGATSFAMGDYTGDSIPDVVEVNTGPDTIGIATGSASGTYSAAVTFALANTARAQAVAAGDIDNNGKLDAVVAEAGLNLVGVFMGNGAGQLTPATTPTYAVPKPVAVVLADFNKDGALDMAVLDNATCVAYLFRGLGTGVFTATTQLPLGSCNGQTTYLTSGDANGDGNSDLLVGYGNAGSVGVFLGDGTGAFPSSRIYIVPADDGPPTVTDVNGDGHPDIVTAGFFYANAVFVSLGH